MKIFNKLFGDKNGSIESLIENAKKQVDQHPTGHLPRPCRVALMQRIADPATVNKIFFECAKNVFPIWEAEFEGVTPVYEMLCKADDFLYRDKGTKEDFKILADKYRNYIEGQNGNAGAAALSALLLCHSIYCDAETILDLEDYNGKDDDNAFEWDAAWTSDFCASLAVSGGSPFLEDGSDIRKRKEFWMWFLDTTLSVVHAPNKPIVSLPELKTTKETNGDNLFARTQTYNTPQIQEKIALIIKVSIEDFGKQYPGVDWGKIIINAFCMKSGNSTKTIFYDEANNQYPVKMTRYSPTDSPPLLMTHIKKDMYGQSPKEGGWIASTIEINEDNSYKIYFNYDDIDYLSEDKKSPDKFVYEFDAYPRSKEFTPEWWQKILGGKAKYLK